VSNAALVAALLIVLLLALGLFVAVLVIRKLVMPGITALITRGAASRMRSSGRPLAEQISVAVTSDGVTVVRPAAAPAGVRWSQLVEVAVVTTSAGPLADDAFLVLRGADAHTCLVPNPVATELVRWSVRLPGFDHERFIAAMGSTSEAAFVCWTGRPGEALVAAREPPASEGDGRGKG
jgi:hypothetical protein